MASTRGRLIPCPLWNNSDLRLYSNSAAVNPGDKFKLVFKSLLENLFVKRMDQNEKIFVRFMDDAPFQKLVTAWMASEAYRRLRSDATHGGEEHTGSN